MQKRKNLSLNVKLKPYPRYHFQSILMVALSVRLLGLYCILLNLFRIYQMVYFKKPFCYCSTVLYTALLVFCTPTFCKLILTEFEQTVTVILHIYSITMINTCRQSGYPLSLIKNAVQPFDNQ